MRECSKDAIHGGHLFIEGQDTDFTYIAPLCATCNNPNNKEYREMKSNVAYMKIRSNECYLGNFNKSKTRSRRSRSDVSCARRTSSNISVKSEIQQEPIRSSSSSSTSSFVVRQNPRPLAVEESSCVLL